MGKKGERERKEVEIIKGHKEAFEGDGYVYYLDCGDNFRDLHIC